MTATDLQARVEEVKAKQPESLSELANRIDDANRKALAVPALDAARTAANESGIRRARQALGEAPAALKKAQDAFREAQAAEREAGEAYHQAEAEAAWEIDGRFVTEGNKTWLTVEGEERRAMTADQRKAYTAAEVRKLPAVRKAEQALREAEEARMAAADAITLAEKTFTACRLEVEAAISELNALSTALRSTQ